MAGPLSPASATLRPVMEPWTATTFWSRTLFGGSYRRAVTGQYTCSLDHRRGVCPVTTCCGCAAPLLQPVHVAEMPVNV